MEKHEKHIQNGYVVPILYSPLTVVLTLPSSEPVRLSLSRCGPLDVQRTVSDRRTSITLTFNQSYFPPPELKLLKSWVAGIRDIWTRGVRIEIAAEHPSNDASCDAPAATSNSPYGPTNLISRVALLTRHHTRPRLSCQRSGCGTAAYPEPRQKDRWQMPKTAQRTRRRFRPRCEEYSLAKACPSEHIEEN